MFSEVAYYISTPFKAHIWYNIPLFVWISIITVYCSLFFLYPSYGTNYLIIKIIFSYGGYGLRFKSE